MLTTEISAENSSLRHPPCPRAAPEPGDTWWEREEAGLDSAPLNQSPGGSLPANGRDAPGLEGWGQRKERRRHRSLGGLGAGPVALTEAERQWQEQSGW